MLRIADVGDRALRYSLELRLPEIMPPRSSGRRRAAFGTLLA